MTASEFSQHINGGKRKMKASVKIMRSYDYNHFEVALSNDENMTLEQVDEMRKEAARLVDKAVSQYQIAKNQASRVFDSYLEQQAKIIKENYPKSQWTEEQKATVKKHEDNVYWANREYDYQDEWE